MEEPPILLGGARVIEYAVFDSNIAPTGHFSTVVEGVPVDLNVVRGLVVAEDLVEGGVFLFHCDERWEFVVAGRYSNTSAARESAEYAYRGLNMQWRVFRQLSSEELAEIETTRAFLRELAAEYPNE